MRKVSYVDYFECLFEDSEPKPCWITALDCQDCEYYSVSYYEEEEN